MSGGDIARAADSSERLVMARQLVEALEAGEEKVAEEQLRALGAESRLYQRVGEVAREVHDRLQDFLSDSGLSRLAHDETPDTRRRLEHVIELTADAAHRTLNAVERVHPHTEAILACAVECNGDESAERVSASHRHVEAIRGELSQIVMAQEFQDLSGQIIKRAIALVTDIETRLIELLSLAGVSPDAVAEYAVSGIDHGEGPRVPGTASEKNPADQDEVDNLLKSLGF